MFQNKVHGATSNFSYPLTAFDFQLELENEESVYPDFVVSGRTVFVSMDLIQNAINTQYNNALYIIQILDENQSAIRIEVIDINLPNSDKKEIAIKWIPEKSGNYTIEGFLWSQANDQKKTETALIAKLSSKIHVIESNSGNNDQTKKIISICHIGCDYSDIQTAIDISHGPDNKLLIKDGNYRLYKPVDIWSHTSLEFTSNANIAFFGDNGQSVFQGEGVEDVQITNPHIIGVAHHGVKAFSFISSNRVSLLGGEITLLQGENSTGFYCRDCRNISVNGASMNGASRFVDIKTISETNDGKSSDIWIKNGVFNSSSIEAIKVNYSNNVHIVDNNISQSNNNAIDIGYNSFSIVRNNNIQNGGIPDGSGIHTDFASNALLFENIINGAGNAGITVYRATNVRIQNNTIVDATENGIAVISTSEPSSNVEIRYNYIKKPFEHGIYVSGNQQYVKILGNHINEIDDIFAITIDEPNLSVEIDENVINGHLPKGKSYDGNDQNRV